MTKKPLDHNNQTKDFRAMPMFVIKNLEKGKPCLKKLMKIKIGMFFQCIMGLLVMVNCQSATTLGNNIYNNHKNHNIEIRIVF